MSHRSNRIAKRVEADKEFQQCMTTTKNTKGTKKLENEMPYAIFQFGVVEVDQYPVF